MRITRTDSPDQHTITFTLTISTDDARLARLDGFDDALLEDCRGSMSIADQLLALELFARRIEEGHDRERRGSLTPGEPIVGRIVPI